MSAPSHLASGPAGLLTEAPLAASGLSWGEGDLLCASGFSQEATLSGGCIVSQPEMPPGTKVAAAHGLW